MHASTLLPERRASGGGSNREPLPATRRRAAPKSPLYCRDDVPSRTSLCVRYIFESRATASRSAFLTEAARPDRKADSSTLFLVLILALSPCTTAVPQRDYLSVSSGRRFKGCTRALNFESSSPHAASSWRSIQRAARSDPFSCSSSTLWMRTAPGLDSVILVNEK